MKERPILFSAPMVRAILEGRKTQTRRALKPQPPPDVVEIGQRPALDPYLKCVVSGNSGEWEDGHGLDLLWRCPYGQPGRRLWVRETWASRGVNPVVRPSGKFGAAVVEYRADTARATWDRDPIQRDPDGHWRPSIHMPRWASRITLEVTGVRVERLNDISEADAIAEGIERIEADRLGAWKKYDGKPDETILGYESPCASYASLWESINGPGSWAANPWVWVVEFKRIGGAK